MKISFVTKIIVSKIAKSGYSIYYIPTTCPNPSLYNQTWTCFKFSTSNVREIKIKNHFTIIDGLDGLLLSFTSWGAKQQQTSRTKVC